MPEGICFSEATARLDRASLGHLTRAGIGICQVNRDSCDQFIWGSVSAWLFQNWVGITGGCGRRPNRSGWAW